MILHDREKTKRTDFSFGQMTAREDTCSHCLGHRLVERRLHLVLFTDLEKGMEITKAEEEHHIPFLNLHRLWRKLRHEELQQGSWHRTDMIDFLNRLTEGGEIVGLLALPVTPNACDTRPLLVGLIPSKNMPSIRKDASCPHELGDGWKDRRWDKGRLLLETREESACELHGSTAFIDANTFKFSVREHGIGKAILEAEPVESNTEHFHFPGLWSWRFYIQDESEILQTRGIDSS